MKCIMCEGKGVTLNKYAKSGSLPCTDCKGSGKGIYRIAIESGGVFDPGNLFLKQLCDYVNKLESDNTKLREQIVRDDMVIELLSPTLEDCQAAFDAAEEEEIPQEKMDKLVNDVLYDIREDNEKGRKILELKAEVKRLHKGAQKRCARKARHCERE